MYFLMQQLGDGVSDEEGFENDGDGGWPFQSFVEQLLVDMFDPGIDKYFDFPAFDFFFFFFFIILIRN